MGKQGGGDDRGTRSFGGKETIAGNGDGSGGSVTGLACEKMRPHNWSLRSGYGDVMVSLVQDKRVGSMSGQADGLPRQGPMSAPRRGFALLVVGG